MTRASSNAAPELARWYLGYRGRGRNTQVLLDNIVKSVHKMGLGNTICAVRIEKKPSHGQIYFFITVESPEAGVLPEDADALMASHPILGTAQYIPVTQPNYKWELDEIHGFVGDEAKVKAFNQCLRYRPSPRVQRDEDPLGAAEDTPVICESSIDTPFRVLATLPCSTQHEQLLWWLSARGAGTWHVLRDTAELLNLGGEREPRRQLRRLRLLGHLESSQDGQRWATTPPAVVTAPTPTGELRFLTGARVPTLLSGGERDGNVGAPDRIRVIEAPLQTEELGFAAHALASALPDVSTWLHSLLPVDSVSTANYRFKRFMVGGWQDSRAEQSGFYELTHRKVVGGQPSALFFDGQHWRRGDWYGLRYAALHAAGDLQCAQHESQTWQLAWPVTQRPPEVYERALVLSSGLLPQPHGGWLLYDNVHPEVANRVSAALAMPLEQR